jgi:hypothetical protein
MKNELFAMIAEAVETDRDQLQDNLNAAKHRQQMKVKRLREIANSWAVTDWQGCATIRALADEIDKSGNDIGIALQALDMHDNAEQWHEIK